MMIPRDYNLEEMEDEIIFKWYTKQGHQMIHKTSFRKAQFVHMVLTNAFSYDARHV